MLLGGCALLQPPLESPELALQAIGLERLNLTEQVFLARLAVSNPNRQRIKINNAVVRLELEGIDLGSGETVSGVSVPAQGEDFVDVRVVTNLLSTAPQLWAWLNSGDATLDYRVSGFVQLGLGGLARLNVDETGQIDAERLLSGRQFD